MQFSSWPEYEVWPFNQERGRDIDVVYMRSSSSSSTSSYGNRLYRQFCGVINTRGKGIGRRRYTRVKRYICQMGIENLAANILPLAGCYSEKKESNRLEQNMR